MCKLVGSVSARGNWGIRVNLFYFQLEEGAVYELVGSIFSWRWVECTSWLVLFSAGRWEECTSWLVLFSAGGGWSVRVSWFYIQLEVGGVYELVGSIFSWRWEECMSWLV